MSLLFVGCLLLEVDAYVVIVVVVLAAADDVCIFVVADVVSCVSVSVHVSVTVCCFM